jgi:hypothetical protein
MLEKKKVYHEAGHAVIARLLGAGVTHIAMFSTRDDNSASAQTVSLGWATKGQDPTAYEKDALIALAGPITQHRFQPVKNFDCAWQNEWHDDGLNARGYVARAYLLRHGVAIGDGPYSFTPEQYKDIDAVLDRLERQATELV